MRGHVAVKMLAQSEVLWLAAGFDLPPRVGQWHRDILRNGPRRRAQQDHSLGDVKRLVEIVGDEQNRQPEVGPELQQQVLQFDPHHRVERAERLVHQQDLRPPR
jgi:hypothetical protein